MIRAKFIATILLVGTSTLALADINVDATISATGPAVDHLGPDQRAVVVKIENGAGKYLP
jgi:hypothetical protein